MSNMPRRMQVLKIREELQRRGVSADEVDVEALVDSTLSYPENARQVLSKHKRTEVEAQRTKGRTKYLGQGGSVDLQYASQYHQARTPTAQAQDNAIRAKTTWTERQLSKKPSRFDTWMSSPNRSDILGIDAHGFSKRRKRRE